MHLLRLLHPEAPYALCSALERSRAIQGLCVRSSSKSRMGFLSILRRGSWRPTPGLEYLAIYRNLLKYLSIHSSMSSAMELTRDPKPASPRLRTSALRRCRFRRLELRDVLLCGLRRLDWLFDLQSGCPYDPPALTVPVYWYKS